MKERFKIVQIPLLVIICLLILTPPAYLGCTNSPGTTKFASSDLFFENLDQKDGLPYSGEKSKVVGLTAFFNIFLLGADLTERSSRSFSQRPSFPQEICVLRC